MGDYALYGFLRPGRQCGFFRLVMTQYKGCLQMAFSIRLITICNRKSNSWRPVREYRDKLIEFLRHKKGGFVIVNFTWGRNSRYTQYEIWTRNDVHSYDNWEPDGEWHFSCIKKKGTEEVNSLCCRNKRRRRKCFPYGKQIYSQRSA